MRSDRLTCPRCRAIYPTLRVIFGWGGLRCPSCQAQLSFSKDSARMLGAVGGLTLFACTTLIAFVLGFEVLWTWRFWAFLMPFSYVLGRITMAIVGRLVLREERS